MGIFLFYPLIDSLFVKEIKLLLTCGTLFLFLLPTSRPPLILYYFGTFPVYFLLSNLVVAPIAVFILSATLLALALGVFPVAANFVVQGLDFAVRTLNEVMEQIQHWSGAQITSAYLSVHGRHGYLLLLHSDFGGGMLSVAMQCRLIVFLLT